MRPEPEPYKPTWTEEEKAATRDAFRQELEKLSENIAHGKYLGWKALAGAFMAINAKISSAEKLGATKSRGISYPRLRIEGDIIRDFEPLVELASNPQIRRSIFERLRKIFLDVGIEPEFLKRINPPEKRDYS